ncbi:hypothetical protein ABW20_dc0103345 [Dactylellina cionopaga]|nr:hypothetical protein ABW20_dc0103345 [Dactylellina cionopaga]
MADMTATVTETTERFQVEGYEKFTYNFTFLDGVFEPSNPQLANCYKQWGRCLAVSDQNIAGLYGDTLRQYMAYHQIQLELFPIKIGEQAKTMATALSIIDKMIDFGIIRKEPVLVIGGGLTTDVAGFACAMHRRSTNFIRIPTTLIGLIDASVSIKMGCNYGKHKNKLGAYHAPIHTFLDFTFLKTLPKSQVRNGFAELIKITTCADLRSFDLLDKYCEELIDTNFGRQVGSLPDIKQAADEINKRGIRVMLQLEAPNLRELNLLRVIAFGHTVSPTLELTPDPPLRHGHAISVDMAYFTTLAWKRGLVSERDHKRVLNLFSRAGLTMNHELFDDIVLMRGIKAIHGVRDGHLHAAIPAPLGSCKFLEDVTEQEFKDALHLHKEICSKYPHEGAGLDAYVDASDTGVIKVDANKLSNNLKKVVKVDHSILSMPLTGY